MFFIYLKHFYTASLPYQSPQHNKHKNIKGFKQITVKNVKNS